MVENQTENRMDNEMETGLVLGGLNGVQVERCLVRGTCVYDVLHLCKQYKAQTLAIIQASTFLGSCWSDSVQG